MKKIREIIWRILGIDYQILLNKMDYVLLKNDRYSHKGIGSYDNGAKVWRWSSASLQIGKYCSIAFNVNFIMDEGYHSCSEITNYPFVNNLTTKPNLLDIKQSIVQREGIQIGNDVWIGMNVIILPGIQIGNGAIIAAGAIVTKNVPDYAIVGGNPAKLIRMKYEPKQIKQMNEIAWWNWDEKKLEENIPSFYGSQDNFIKKYHEN